MHSLLRWAAGVALTALLAGGLAALSDFPMGAQPDHGVLRLAWRITSQKVSLCRERSPAELEKLPLHMRLPRVCTDHLLPYVLTVAVEGEQKLVRRVEAAGAHSDRPIYIQEDLPLPPGSHDVAITFEPDAAEPAGESARGTAMREALAKARRFRFSASLEIARNRVTLVQLFEQRGEFSVSGP
jgi:hypothetical protein